ncbi:hypothetical protein [Chondromyces apiculatus]|uniref:Uncharacterized protein n=1 Tax=Chondromyces apiculatus DSM 436 TaxID=1192034 RepID=A0A017T6U8_9BACT|nr:hypothetical protein [Chondromyces apiculatus]EYF04737.1 Hypothetical protein CAP_4213 [Chondromyces apiculatus DSM 436]
MSASLLLAETRTLLRARRTKLSAGLLLYAVIAVPFLLARPPAEVVSAVARWFPSRDPAFALFLFVWFDLGLNKLAALIGVVLAGGIVLDAEAQRMLPIYLAKPITRARYFLTRLGAAAIVFSLLFGGAALAGLLLFPSQVPGFRAPVFLAASALHLLGALSAVVLSGAMAVWVRLRLGAMLSSLVLLFTLIGTAFLGFYAPAWAPALTLNPFSQGVSVLAHIDTLRPADVARPAAILLSMHAAVVALGALRVRRLEV